MSDEEEDYMSDKFLAGLAEVRPSLINDRAKKRQVDIKIQQKAHIKRQREERLERSGANSNERLQESLKRPIEAENKGFQLLAKMGYKPGQALGKNTDTNDVATASTTARQPLTEPIGIVLKSGRGGLGREAALQELALKRNQLRMEHLRKLAGDGAQTAEEYRKRATQKAEERFMFGALRRCQLSCEDLDTKNDVIKPEMSWFWPERVIEEEPKSDDETEVDSKNGTTSDNDDKTKHKSSDDEQDEYEYNNAEKLDMLTNYLRTSYRFCFWCGEHYKDDADLDSNCPGLTRDEH